AGADRRGLLQGRRKAGRASGLPPLPAAVRLVDDGARSDDRRAAAGFLVRDGPRRRALSADLPALPPGAVWSRPNPGMERELERPPLPHGRVTSWRLSLPIH